MGLLLSEPYDVVHKQNTFLLDWFSERGQFSTRINKREPDLAVSQKFGYTCHGVTNSHVLLFLISSLCILLSVLICYVRPHDLKLQNIATKHLAEFL